MDCGFFFPYILHSLLLRIYRAVSSKQKLKEKKSCKIESVKENSELKRNTPLWHISWHLFRTPSVNFFLSLLWLFSSLSSKLYWQATEPLNTKMQTENYEVELWKDKTNWEDRTEEPSAFLLGCQAPVLSPASKQMMCNVRDWIWD